jgi:hypothetical protein
MSSRPIRWSSRQREPPRAVATCQLQIPQRVDPGGLICEINGTCRDPPGRLTPVNSSPIGQGVGSPLRLEIVHLGSPQVWRDRFTS